MASILDRYGIKEVCDFTFYTIDDTTGKPSAPALYLDTLKVSTVEQTADLVEAKGGKGNVTLLSWDTNKSLTVTLEDALFSAKSLAIMFGNGTLKSYTGDTAYIMKTEVWTATATSATATSAGWSNKFEGPDGDLYDKRNAKFYEANGEVASTFVSGTSYFCSYDLKIDGSVVEISANSFPGTYYCVGDTYARNAKSGRNEFFQLIIPKAKVQSENTITMQAEGDPSTFNMSLKVMKPDDGIMMKLVKYDAVEGTSASAEATTASLDHNHVLAPSSSLPLLKSFNNASGTFSNVATVTGVTSSTSTTITPTTSDITVACSTDTVTITGTDADAGFYTVTVTGLGVIDVKVD